MPKACTRIKPGEVRNPTGKNGRKDAAAKLKAELEKFLKGDLGEKARWDWLLEAWFAAALKGSAPHIGMLLDRVYGKAKEQIEITGEDGPIDLRHQLDFSGKSDEELRKIAARSNQK